eukprot:2861895-Amphidinium_carterae.1
MTRSQVVGIENQLGLKMPHGHALTHFALPHAAHCLINNCYRTGADGRTAEELRTGRTFKRPAAIFGEKVLGYPLKTDLKKRD